MQGQVVPEGTSGPPGLNGKEMNRKNGVRPIEELNKQAPRGLRKKGEEGRTTGRAPHFKG